MNQKQEKLLYYFRCFDPALPEQIAKQMLKSTNLGKVEFGDIFKGQEERTVITAGLLAEAHPQLLRGANWNVLEEIGDNTLLNGMYTGAATRALANGKYNELDIFRKVHGTRQTSEWCAIAYQGVRKMFERMTGARAVACGHHPIAPMAVAYMIGYFINLSPLGCLVFRQDEQGIISFAPELNPYLGIETF